MAHLSPTKATVIFNELPQQPIRIRILLLIPKEIRQFCRKHQGEKMKLVYLKCQSNCYYYYSILINLFIF